MYERKDHYYWKAKEESLLSRAAYKLMEINKRYGLIKRRMKVLDVGCSPGGWSQVASKIVGRRGLVVGVDIEPPAFQAPNFKFVQGDIMDRGTWERVKEVAGGLFHVVLSDVAPKTSGIYFKDVAASIEMCQVIVSNLRDLLVPGGACVLKVFEGEGFKEFKDSLRREFESVKAYKPPASRSSSREIYLILKNYTRGI